MEIKLKAKNNKNLFLFLFLIFIILLFSFLIYKNHFSDKKFDDVNLSRVHQITKIKVLTGDKYEISYFEKEMEFCILGKLSCNAKNESKYKVINLLNQVKSPKLLIISKREIDYIIEIIFEQNDKDVKISDWLKYNKLTYD